MFILEAVRGGKARAYRQSVGLFQEKSLFELFAGKHKQFSWRLYLVEPMNDIPSLKLKAVHVCFNSSPGVFLSCLMDISI